MYFGLGEAGDRDSREISLGARKFGVTEAKLSGALEKLRTLLEHFPQLEAGAWRFLKGEVFSGIRGRGRAPASTLVREVPIKFWGSSDLDSLCRLCDGQIDFALLGQKVQSELSSRIDFHSHNSRFKLVSLIEFIFNFCRVFKVDSQNVRKIFLNGEFSNSKASAAKDALSLSNTIFAVFEFIFHSKKSSFPKQLSLFQGAIKFLAQFDQTKRLHSNALESFYARIGAHPISSTNA